MTTREEELKRIPPYKPDKSKWPKHIRTAGLEEHDNLGIDAKGMLYWDGKLIHIQKHELGKVERRQAWIIATCTIIPTAISVMQFLQSYKFGLFHFMDGTSLYCD